MPTKRQQHWRDAARKETSRGNPGLATFFATLAQPNTHEQSEHFLRVIDRVRFVTPLGSPATMPREQAERLRQADSEHIAAMREAGAGDPDWFEPYLEEVRG